MINTNFETQFPGLVGAIWTFVSDASAEAEGHFATYLPVFGLFDRIDLHISHDFLCLRACDTLNGIEQFAVLAP